MMLLDIPFQVDEEHLRDCLKTRLDVIADIVIEVDEPTWLLWQSRREERCKIKDGQKKLKIGQPQPLLDGNKHAELKRRRLSDPTDELYHQETETNVSAFSDGDARLLENDESNMFDEDDDIASPSNISTTSDDGPAEALYSEEYESYRNQVQSHSDPQQALTVSSQNVATPTGIVSPNNYGQTAVYSTAERTFTPCHSTNQSQYSQNTSPYKNSALIQQLHGNIKREVIDLSKEDYTAPSYSGSYGYFNPYEDQKPAIEHTKTMLHQQTPYSQLQNYQSLPLKKPKIQQSPGTHGSSRVSLYGLPSASGVKSKPQPITSPLKSEPVMLDTFYCPFRNCGKMFSSKAGLQSHERVHMSLQPFDCKICHRKFTHGSSYKRHLRNVHSVEVKTVNSEETYQMILK